jgi:hypothetical protein
MIIAHRLATEKNHHKLAEIIHPHTLPYLKSDYNCPICYDYMSLPKMIYSCHNVYKSHFICSVCLDNLPKKECPSCKEDFHKRRPRRCQEAEKRAKELESEIENN